MDGFAPKKASLMQNFCYYSSDSTSLGSYKLNFLNAKPEQSGTYICKFDKQGVEASSKIALNIK